MKGAWRLALACALALCAAILLPRWGGGDRGAQAATGKRVALVIGNSSYPSKPLPSPVKDAAQWTTSLQGAGFDVDLCQDCKLQQMKDRLKAFKAKIAPGDEAFFYYAGHGAEENDINLLFPVDADVQGCGTLFEQSVSLSYVLDVMAKAAVKVVVLDACRTSPFPTCTMNNDPVVYGAPQVMPSGTLIAYATRRGDPAADTGKGSAYSRELLPLAFQPGKALYDAISEAGMKVQQASNGRQDPWVLSNLSPASYALRPMISPAVAADAAWQGIAAMADGPAKRAAAVDLLSQYGTLDTTSVRAARGYLTGDSDSEGTASASPQDLPPTVAKVVTSAPSALPALGKVGDPPSGGPTGQTYIARKGTTGEMTFIGLSGGVFDMGSPEGVGDADERPQHRVRVSAFAMAQSEVTQSQWTAVVSAAQKAKDNDAKGLKLDPSAYKGAQRPVENVSWCDAARFANALSRLEGKRPVYTVGLDCDQGGSVPWDPAANGYRLPTEAEWEYAARAGTTWAWFFGDDPDQLCAYANVADQTGEKKYTTLSIANCDDGATETTSVCSYQKNPWGLCDVHGNVWEWTWDVYDGGYYSRSPATDPAGPADRGAFRVLRGGSWGGTPGSARSANRFWLTPSNSLDFVGFRLVLPVAVSEP